MAEDAAEKGRKGREAGLVNEKLLAAMALKDKALNASIKALQTFAVFNELTFYNLIGTSSKDYIAQLKKALTPSIASKLVKDCELFKQLLKDVTIHWGGRCLYESNQNFIISRELMNKIKEAIKE